MFLNVCVFSRFFMLFLFWLQDLWGHGHDAASLLGDESARMLRELFLLGFWDKALGDPNKKKTCMNIIYVNILPNKYKSSYCITYVLDFFV